MISIFYTALLPAPGLARGLLVSVLIMAPIYAALGWWWCA